MNILLIGSGGREHAILQSIANDNRIDKIFAIPGNGAMEEVCECISDIGATDIDKIVEFAQNHPIDYAIVAPDDPLALGLVDRLEEIGIQSFGPNQAAAQIEASKAFSKNLMKKYNIPTAEFEVFDNKDEAISYIQEKGAPIVIKADGLALGKGVTVAMTEQEAIDAITDAMENKKFGSAGDKIVIEEYLTGPEVSVLSFTDGETIIPMVSSMDHKRANDNDEGPNTGGMGTIAPNIYYTDEIAQESMEKIFKPTIQAMKEEGSPFKGCLYFGLMITEDGPKVIEYNCRFGDPEAQVVLPLLKTNLLDIMQAVTNERLDEVEVNFDNKNACCVVMASEGYPIQYDSGYEITLPELEENEYIYIAGAKKEDDKLLSNGGRVLGAVAIADNLEDAITQAYQLSDKIHFENAYRREDIGQKALKVLKEN